MLCIGANPAPGACVPLGAGPVPLLGAERGLGGIGTAAAHGPSSSRTRLASSSAREEGATCEGGERVERVASDRGPTNAECSVGASL
eukprot:1420271-Pyramimonas_sp.AAC.1